MYCCINLILGIGFALGPPFAFADATYSIPPLTVLFVVIVVIFTAVQGLLVHYGISRAKKRAEIPYSEKGRAEIPYKE